MNNPRKVTKLEVLLVEDNKALGLGMRIVLERLFCTVEIATTGEEGVIKAASKDYDIILMDWGLPGILGIEAARQIRVLPDREKANILIVAVTASYSIADVIEGFREVGVTNILEKPKSGVGKITNIIARFHLQKKMIAVDT